MSKNYELLRQVEFGLGSAPFAIDGSAAVTEENIAPAAPLTLPSLERTIREETLKLVQRVFLAQGQVPAPKVVMFAAVDMRNGSNWLCSVAANLLATSVAGSVCLMEGDFREPSLSGMLGVECERGFVDSLQQYGPIKGFAKQVGPNNLWLLPAGEAVRDSMGLLNSERMKERLREVRTEFDYVVMNAPPLNAFADAMVLGRSVDGVVLVLEANATRRGAALRVMDSLRATSIPVLGAVLNNRTFPIPAALYKRI
jgi:Mrp family chromosome partitioning ATPase